MAKDTKKAFSVMFSIGGKLDQSLKVATGEAQKLIEKTAKKTKDQQLLSQLESRQRQAMKGLEAASKKMSKAWSDVGRSIMVPIRNLALLAAAGGAAAYSIASKTAKWGDEVYKTAQKIGITTEAMSKLAYAAQQSNVSTQELSTGMRNLRQNITKAIEGNADALLAFRRVDDHFNLYNKDGSLKKTDEILIEVSDRFKKMADAGVDSVYMLDLATTVFGNRAGAALMPLLVEGSEGIEAMRKEAEELGIVFDDVSGLQAKEFQDSVTRLKASFQGLMMAVGKPLLEPITKIQIALGNWVASNRELVSQKVNEFLERIKENLPRIKDFMFEVRDALVGVVRIVKGLIDKLGGPEEALKKITKAWVAFQGLKILISLGTAIAATVKFAGALKKVIVITKALLKLKWVIAIGKGIAAVFSIAALKIIAIVAAIAALVYGIWWVIKNWDKVRAFLSKVGEMIIGGFIIMWEKIKGIFTKFIDYVKSLFEEGFLKGIIKVLAHFTPYYWIMKAINKIFGIDLIAMARGWMSGLGASIIGGFQIIGNGIISIFTNFIDYVKGLFDDGLIKGIIRILAHFTPQYWIMKAINKIFDIDLIQMGKDWMSGLITGILEVLRNGVSAIGSAFSNLIPNPIKNLFSRSGEGVPAFAQGGIVNRPTLAMVGEDGAEAIIPLNKPDRAKEIIAQITPKLDQSGGGKGGGASFVFSPTINVNGGEANSIKPAVTDALNEAKRYFEKWISDRERNQLRASLV